MSSLQTLNTITSDVCVFSFNFAEPLPPTSITVRAIDTQTLNVTWASQPASVQVFIYLPYYDMFFICLMLFVLQLCINKDRYVM